MSDRELLAEALDRLLQDHDADATAPTAFDGALWSALDEAGFTRIGVPEANGGSGGSAEDAHLVLDRIGAHAADVPVVETIVAGWLCAQAGLSLPAGVATFAPARPGDTAAVTGGDGTWRVRGRFRRVPWATVADHVVVAAPHADGTVVGVVPVDAVHVTPGHNVAGEPRDSVEVDAEVLGAAVVAASPDAAPDAVLAWGALARSVACAGALRRILELTRDHVATRVQFGQPLVSFPIVRHHLAELAGEVAAATVAAESALVAGDGVPAWPHVAAAKIRTARAASVVAATAHQLHGAIGFTDENVLHRSTRRVWAWRDECGTQGWWEERLGAAVAAAGADAVWPGIVG